MSKHFLDNSLEPDWQSMSADKVEPQITQALERAQSNLSALAKLPKDQWSYQSVMQAFDDSTEELVTAWTKVGHLDAVKNHPELRNAHNTMLPKVSEFFTKIYLDNALWDTIKGYAQSEEGQALTGIQKRHLNEVIEDFKESGADLNPDQKARLEALNAELAKLTQKYSENVLDATNAWDYITDSEDELKGLPQSAIDAAKQDAESKNHKGKFRFTLHAPSITPVLQYADSDALREKLWRASVAVGHNQPFDNTDLIGQILKLRQEKAEILGEKDFADWVLKRRMAKSGTKALEFSDDMFDRVEERFLQEVEQLEQFKADYTQQSKDQLEPWEVGYWAEKQRKARFDFDEEELRPYFPVESVMSGMYAITERLFNIQVQEDPTVQGWHEDVKYYKIYERRSSKLLGAFYADWFPREEKRGGAWMNNLHTGNPGEPHLGIICGNFTKPVGDKPALLTHREVETIFHEFGHLLHHILGDVEVKSLQGVNVAWDFVELPSQIMENWCWERESLDLFARHWETGEAIPEALYQKLKATRTYLSGLATMRQLSIGKMDLELHINHRGQGGDLDAFVDQVLDGYIIKTKTKAPTYLRRLGHVFADPTGYASGYYSYKWAEVLDADAFTRFKRDGILNEDTGIDFREKILSMGNAEPPEDLFRAFMGRDPQMDALLERSGLL